MEQPTLAPRRTHPCECDGSCTSRALACNACSRRNALTLHCGMVWVDGRDWPWWVAYCRWHQAAETRRAKRMGWLQ